MHSFLSKHSWSAFSSVVCRFQNLFTKAGRMDECGNDKVSFAAADDSRCRDMRPFRKRPGRSTVKASWLIRQESIKRSLLCDYFLYDPGLFPRSTTSLRTLPARTMMIRKKRMRTSRRKRSPRTKLGKH